MMMMHQQGHHDGMVGKMSMGGDEHHVVVGRMEIGPQGALRLLDESGERMMFDEKGMAGGVGEEEEEEDDDDVDKGVVHHVYHHQDHQNGGGGGQQGQGGYHHAMAMANGKSAGEDEMEGKLVEMMNDAKRDERDRQMSDGDAGTANSPQLGGGKSGGRRSSRDPAIEWSEGATTVLLHAFAEKYRALDRGNFTSKIWADIATRVNGRGAVLGMNGNVSEGIPKTQEQCRIKVDNLKKRYKVEREKRRVSGSASKWPFYDMMDDLIGANPRHMRGGGGGAAAIGGEDSPLAIENGTPLGIRSSGDGERLYYLDTGVGGEGDQTSETVPRISPVYGRGRRKRALEDLERERINGPSLRALFEGYNVPLNIIDAMIQEDMDDTTLINSKDISSLLDQLRMKHRIQLKLGPAERIKQAIEVAKEKKILPLEQC